MTSGAARVGFTLIELAIALMLSLVILYTAFTGFRVASQSVTLSNRLSLENSLLRAGYFAAVEEADFWTAYDDPTDAGRERLRAFVPDASWKRGCPFAPFTTTLFPPNQVGSGTEAERGWDPAYCWPANDARGWFEGNLVEECGVTTHTFGHYELFFHHKDHPSLMEKFGRAQAFGAAVDATHTWYCNQLESLKNAMGYYGACDYMPANAIYGVMGDPGGDNSYGTGDDSDQSLSHEWCEPSGSGGGRLWRFANDDGGTRWARGIYRCTRDSTYAVVPASADTRAVTSAYSDQELTAHHAHSWATDRVRQASDPATSGGGLDLSHYGVRDLYARTQMASALLPRRPASWPNLVVKSMRYLSNSRFVYQAVIGWTDPVLGESASVSFSLLGTTLRGARQQRRAALGGGWAVPGHPAYPDLYPAIPARVGTDTLDQP